VKEDGMRPVVIGFLGEKGAGKGTAAEVCMERGFTSIAFTDPMKRFVRDVFDWNITTLWGPTELREIPDQRSSASFRRDVTARFCLLAPQFLIEMRIDPRHESKLVDWFQDAWSQPELIPRYVLQTLGTEFGRRVNEFVWVDYCFKTIDQIYEQCLAYHPVLGLYRPAETRPRITQFVIHDVRFRNEVDEIRRFGGKIIELQRPQPSNAPHSQHVSETEQRTIPRSCIDRVIQNNSSLDKFRDKVVSAVFGRRTALLATTELSSDDGEEASPTDEEGRKMEAWDSPSPSPSPTTKPSSSSPRKGPRRRTKRSGSKRS